MISGGMPSYGSQKPASALGAREHSFFKCWFRFIFSFNFSHNSLALNPPSNSGAPPIWRQSLYFGLLVTNLHLFR